MRLCSLRVMFAFAALLAMVNVGPTPARAALLVTSFNTDQMMVKSCDESKLVVRNWNATKLDFHYQLNFVTNAGDKVRPFDPIIQNDGGGTKPTLTISNQ